MADVDEEQLMAFPGRRPCAPLGLVKTVDRGPELISRRHTLCGLAAILQPACASIRAKSRTPSEASAAGSRAAERRVASIEASVQGRLGVAVRHTNHDRGFSYRADARYPLCSTFKLLAAAAVLARVDRKADALERWVPYSRAQLLEYAPVTRANLGHGGMTLGELCVATVAFSDNTAGNLLLDSLGGPSALTHQVAAWGDNQTRLDRNEPMLGEAVPGDARDTTTPAAMLRDMEALLLGSLLSPPSRQTLIAWLVASTTGKARLRAGLPADWRVGDKTGTGEHGATNDVAIFWPNGRGPVLIAAYLRDSPAGTDARNQALAEVGRVVADWCSAG
jgi:beta-lactamase class A